MNAWEKFIYDRPLADSEKVTGAVFASTGTYAFGRCSWHSLIATPDPDGTIRAAAKINCTNPGCTATTVFIADPIAYLQERSAPNLTLAEVEAILKEEDIKVRDWLRYDNCRPERLGRFRLVSHVENPKTKEYLANEKAVVHLPDHDLYIEASGCKDWDDAHEKKRWEYELRAVKPQKHKVDAVPAKTVTTYTAA